MINIETSNEMDEPVSTQSTLINETFSQDSMNQSLSSRAQTSKKSTGGLNKYQNQSIMKQVRSNSNDSSNLYDESSNGSTSSTQMQLQPPQQSFGLKLILKRQSGDKYEIKNSTGPPSSPASNCSHDSSGMVSNSERPKREAARKVKFIFSETESDESPLKKRPKYTNNPMINIQNRSNLLLQPKQFRDTPRPIQKVVRRVSQQEEYKEVLLPFEKNELVEINKSSKIDLIENQPKVALNHSIPFPIALVEDKTNIVHTKALLLIHLYQSYSSPCIICVLCKKFFSIGEFSKHFHISEEDLDDEDDTDAESDSEQYASYINIIEKKKEKKLVNLRKKSYKILPYCLNQNNELNENQLKIWKLFSERFTHFKQKRQAAIQAQVEVKQKPQHLKDKSNLRPKSKKQKIELKNWDHIDDSDEPQDKRYYLNKNRLECERIVYLKKNGSKLSDDDQSESENSNFSDAKIKNIENNNLKQNVKNKILKPEEPDLSLSEDEEPENDVREEQKALQELIKSNIEPTTNENNSKCHYYYEKPPTLIEKYFNYYDNLSKEILHYLSNNSSIVIPQSLILYKIKNRIMETRRIMLAQTNYYKSLWLSLTLDLEVKKPKTLI